MKNGFFFLTVAFAISMSCSSTDRKPTSVNAGPRSHRVMITELDPYLIKENHPERSILIENHGAIDLFSDYFSRTLHTERPAASVPDKATPFLDAMLSCDAPFEFREETARSRQPGPAQVRFRLYDHSFTKHPVTLYPSDDVTECRLFLKIPDQPKVVYGLRLVTQPDPDENGARTPAATEAP